MIGTNETLEDQKAVYKSLPNLVVIAMTLLSLIGSGFVIYMYLTVKYLRTFAFKLVFCLSLFDFLYLTNLIASFLF